MKLLCVILLATLATNANAITGFFKYRQDMEGPYSMCVYTSALGENVLIIRDVEICPVTARF